MCALRVATEGECRFKYNTAGKKSPVARGTLRLRSPVQYIVAHACLPLHTKFFNRVKLAFIFLISTMQDFDVVNPTMTDRSGDFINKMIGNYLVVVSKLTSRHVIFRNSICKALKCDRG